MKTELHLHQWEIDQPKAIMLIVHGMAEHGARYDHFAKYLNASSIGVYAPDLRGHGKTAGDVANLGYKEDGDFFKKTIGDIESLVDQLREKNKDIPIILFGHSMGSLLSRAYIAINGNNVDAAILSGTAGDPGFLAQVGMFIAKVIGMFKGKKTESPLLMKMSFGKYNNEFSPARTEYDWLSRDEAEVDKYSSDPFCGTTFTSGFWVGLLKGIQYINSNQAFGTTPKNLPIYIFAGDKDPVGDGGHGVRQVHAKYLDAGIENCELILYPDARHEMLNETNRSEVYQNISSWIKNQLSISV